MCNDCNVINAIMLLLISGESDERMTIYSYSYQCKFEELK